MKKIIITGSPGTGKSTLIDQLAPHCNVCREVSRSLMKSQPTKEISPWGDVETFSRLALEQMLLQYENVPDSCCIYDRAIPDLVVWLRYRGALVDPIYEKMTRKHLAGSLVFFAPPWEEIYISEPLRPETFEESLALSDLTKEVYSRLGFKLIELKKDTPSERATQVMRIIKTYLK